VSDLQQAKWPTDDLGIAREGIRRAAVFGHHRYRAPSPVPPKVSIAKPKKREEVIPLPITYRPCYSGNWRHSIKGEHIRNRIHDIVVVTAAAFDVEPLEMQAECRQRRVVYPRFAAMHMMRAVLRLSVTSIGRVLKRDHTTVLAGLLKASQLRRRDKDFRYRSRVIAKELRRRWSVDGQAEATK
jgi:hypothetical protein